MDLAIDNHGGEIATVNPFTDTHGEAIKRIDPKDLR